jgi:CDP-diacylglycerol---serine O-phosphatidyltransferase
MNVITQAIPSVLTLASLYCGMISVLNTFEGNLLTAAWLIIAATLFDALDGRASRLLGAESHFGVELDSIVDVCSFGFAPAVLGYVYVTTNLPGLTSFAAPLAFVFLACGALRLARFNAQLKGFNKSVFSGLPIPAAAGVLAAFVVFVGTDAMGTVALEWAFPLLQGLLAVLMVSTVSYATLPRLSWDTKSNRIKLVIFLPTLALAAIFPAELLFVFGLSYVGYGLVRAAAHLVLPERRTALDDDSEEALA